MSVGIFVKPDAASLNVILEHFCERFWSVKVGNATGIAVFLPKVLEPDNLPIGGIDERNPKAIKVEGAVRYASGITLGLHQHILRSKRKPLCFNDA